MTHDGFCPDCGFFQAHGASCSTRLRTPEQRIERATHLFAVISNPKMARSRCERDGISQAERREGRALAEARQKERSELLSYLGDPAYGGWTRSAPLSRIAPSETTSVPNKHFAKIRR